MGEEYNLSDCSWKKMVIAKANNEWISTIKSEQTDTNNTVNTTNFSLSDEQIPFRNVKTENEDVCADQAYQNLEDESDDMGQDPLLVEEPCKRRRRKGSGPKNETAEERAARLAKMSAYAAQRLANETPDQRAMRLKRMSEYAAKRLAQETSEQRAKRLARMSAYAAKRLAEETPEQRRARLARMSAYAARRQAMKKMMSPGTSDSVTMTNESYHQQHTDNLQMINNLMHNQS